MTGASVQQPRQATFSTVNSPLGSVSLPRADAEVAFQGVLHQFRAFHVAGRAVADADDVLADRPVAELCVKCGNSRDRRRSDFGQPADSLHGLAGQVAKMRLNGLQNGDHGLGASSQTRDGFIDELEIVSFTAARVRGG